MFMPAMYTNSMLEYFSEYFGMLIYDDTEDFRDSEVIMPELIGGMIYPPFFSLRVSEKEQKEIIKNFLDVMDCDNEIFVDLNFGNGLSLWHQMLLEKGCNFEISYKHYIDFSKPLKIRKSYKNLIKQYKKDYEPMVTYDPEIIKEFKAKHTEVSGRQTRSDETWEAQERGLQEEEAFITYIPGIAYSYFAFSKDECLYHSAAYDRSLTEGKGIPLGHLCLNLAIEHTKEIGCRWMNLGDAVFSGDEKEKNISFFKSGFTNCLLPVFIARPKLRRVK